MEINRLLLEAFKDNDEIRPVVSVSLRSTKERLFINEESRPFLSTEVGRKELRKRLHEAIPDLRFRLRKGSVFDWEGYFVDMV